jgi:hypothetical protein
MPLLSMEFLGSVGWLKANSEGLSAESQEL